MASHDGVTTFEVAYTGKTTPTLRTWWSSVNLGQNAMPSIESVNVSKAREIVEHSRQRTNTMPDPCSSTEKGTAYTHELYSA
jgi:hypothetical protein